MSILIERLNHRDINFALEQTRREGWHHARTDFERLLFFQPEGCFVARIDSKRVGMICSILYESYSFLGCLIVHPAYRRLGIGEILMKTAINFLESMGALTIELDAVFPAVSLYRRMGFKDKFLSLRFERNVDPANPSKPKCEVALPVNKIIDYDRQATGLSRERVIARITEEFNRGVIFSENRSAMNGYAVIREHGGGRRAIGPLVADNPAVAEDLLSRIMEDCGKVGITIGVPEFRREFIETLSGAGFNYKPPSLRMYRGKSLPVSDKVFAILSAEKG